MSRRTEGGGVLVPTQKNFLPKMRNWPMSVVTEPQDRHLAAQRHRSRRVEEQVGVDRSN